MKQKINIAGKTMQYLSKYRIYSIAIVLFILVGTVFEGISIGMLAPFLQQVMSPDVDIFAKIPIIHKLNVFGNHQNRNLTLAVLLFFFFLLILFKNILFVFGKRLMWRLRFLLYRELQNSLFDSLILGGLVFFESAKSGHIVHSFNRETERISAYIYNMLNLIAISTQIIIYLLLLTFFSWQLSSISMLLIIFIFPIVHRIRKKRELLSAASNKAQADVNFVLLEILSGIRIVKLYVSENLTKNWFGEATDEFVKKEYKASFLQELIAPVSEIIIFGFICLVFAATVIFMEIDLSIVLPQLIVSAWILLRALAQLNSFNHFRTEMAGCVGALRSYNELLDRIRNTIIPNGVNRADHFREKIEFKNVTFGYSPGNLVLKDISFSIPKGKVTAIVGSSGAGKTTILNLIPRLYDAVSGEILVDGINLKDLDFYSWRKKIGFVSQDVFIFNSTVNENITFGLLNVSKDKIVAAAKAANIHDFLITLKEGYDTFLGERGIRLSAGQKQRISIARAILRDPEILILDEATSSLDSESEHLVQEAMDRISRKRTVIVIAHRLSTIQDADRLFVLENGEIIESGSHRELLERNGRYATLYRFQFQKNN